MSKLSYFELKSGILDDFYLEMINHGHNLNGDFETVIGYLSYDYEEGFSNIEEILIDFIIYVISGKFISKKISENAKLNIQEKIKSNDFKLLMGVLSLDDKSNFLHDLYQLNFIDEDIKNQFMSLPSIDT